MAATNQRRVNVSFLHAQRKGSNGLLALIGATLGVIFLAQTALAEEVIDGSLAAAEEATDGEVAAAEEATGPWSRPRTAEWS